MSNEQSHPSGDDESDPDPDGDGNEDERGHVDETDSLEPGGGPRRVVSEKSVDDILASLDDTDGESKTDSTDADSNASGATVTTTTAESGDPLESVTTEFDEDDVPAPQTETGAAVPESEAETGRAISEAEADAGDRNDNQSRSGSTSADETAEGGNGEDDDSTALESEDHRPRDEAAADDGHRDENEADDGRTDEDEIEPESDAQDLAARIERGDVTGADVRAAEAGGGRESTPEIDAVDLSMDDLESGAAEVNGPATSSTAGPLAGSIDGSGETNADGTDDSSGASDDTDGDGDSREGGLLGRIKRFFS